MATIQASFANAAEFFNSLLERHSAAWTALPAEQAVALVDSYRQTAEVLAARFGACHQNFTGDGHLFLFDSTDVAIQFGLSLIDLWDRVGAPNKGAGLRLRLGCHYGECALLEQGTSWIGRAIGLAKRVESSAEPGSLFATETVLELLDLPIYVYESVGSFALKGDHLPQRGLYRIVSFDRQALKAISPDRMSAEEAFLRGLESAGTSRAEQEEEARWYQEAITHRSDYAEAHNNLAIVLRRLSREREATLHYHQALRIRPDYPEANYNYGLLLAAQGKLVGACEQLGKSIEQRPDYAVAHHALGNILKLRGDVVGSKQAYERALELRPTSAEMHNDFALLLQQIDQHAQAREHFRTALQLRPEYPEAHYNYALLLEDMGHAVAAQKHYEQALALWPNYSEAHNNLAALLHTQGCIEEAEPHYRKALALRPSDPEAHYNYGLLLREKGDEAGAQQYFALAKNLTPESYRSDTVIDSSS
jgi:Tfp pilus assembly protein PilF